MLQSMGFQTVRHDLEAEKQQQTSEVPLWTCCIWDIRHPSGNVKWAVRYSSLDWAGCIDLRLRGSISESWKALETQCVWGEMETELKSEPWEISTLNVWGEEHEGDREVITEVSETPRECRVEEASWVRKYVLLLLLFSCQVKSNSLQQHGLQHARLPSPSPSPGVCPSSCPKYVRLDEDWELAIGFRSLSRSLMTCWEVLMQSWGWGWGGKPD